VVIIVMLVIIHTDVVVGVWRLSAVTVCVLYVCIFVYVITLKQKPLDIPSPNLTGE